MSDQNQFYSRCFFMASRCASHLGRASPKIQPVLLELWPELHIVELLQGSATDRSCLAPPDDVGLHPNAVYGEFFPDAPPARATVQVARLPRDVKIEISAIATRENAD